MCLSLIKLPFTMKWLRKLVILSKIDSLVPSYLNINKRGLPTKLHHIQRTKPNWIILFLLNSLLSRLPQRNTSERIVRQKNELMRASHAFLIQTVSWKNSSKMITKAPKSRPRIRIHSKFQVFESNCSADIVITWNCSATN